MRDSIDRQAAIDAVHEEFDDCLVWDESGKATADEVERVLGALPSVQSKPRWIPVTEDKPRKRSNILVTDFNTVVEAYYASDENWFDLLGTELKGVIAWMPFPEPYVEHIY